MSENVAVPQENAPPASNGEVGIAQIEAEQRGEPAAGAPAPEQVAESEEQRQERVKQASQTMREQRERNRQNAEERVQSKAWQKVAETLAAKLAEQGKPAPAPQQAQVEAPPDRQKFANWDDFQAEVARFNARQEARAEFNRLQTAAQMQHAMTLQQQEAQRVEADHRARNREFARAMPDFEDVTDRDDITVPGPACEAIKRLPNGPQIVYTIGHNPDIADTLNRMGPMEQQVYIGQISSWLATQGPRISNAAPAGRTVGSKPSPSSDLPEDVEAYMAAANKKFGRN